MLVFSGSARFDATYYGGNIDTTTAGRVDIWRFFSPGSMSAKEIAILANPRPYRGR
jgi:hypothetical protein